MSTSFASGFLEPNNDDSIVQDQAQLSNHLTSNAPDRDSPPAQLPLSNAVKKVLLRLSGVLRAELHNLWVAFENALTWQSARDAVKRDSGTKSEQDPPARSDRRKFSVTDVRQQRVND